MYDKKIVRENVTAVRDYIIIWAAIIILAIPVMWAVITILSGVNKLFN